MKIAVTSLILFFSCSCGANQSDVAPGQAPVEQQEEVVAPIQAPVEEAGAQAVDVKKECVETCIASRQMKAISVDTIEANCESECAE